MKKAVWDLKTQGEKYLDKEVFDCMLAEFLLSAGRSVGTEEQVMHRYGVDNLEDLAIKQKEVLETMPTLLSLYHDIELPLASVLFKMEQEGIMLDTQKLREVGVSVQASIDKVKLKLLKEMGKSINLNSSVQVGEYLANTLGVPLSRTKTGRYATSEGELRKYAVEFDVIQDLLEYRMLSKLASTYIESLVEKADGDGRIHTTYNQMYVSTGRLASSNPNLQNIPTTSEYGLLIKSSFVAPEGRVLVSFDYSQQELRILAHLSGEEKLIEAFHLGRDVHKTTAMQIFSVEYDEVTPEMRSAAKTINFGIIYGMGKFGLSEGLGITVEEAEKFIKAFNSNYPAIGAYYAEYLERGKRDGYVETMLGRRRYVFESSGQKFIDNSTRRVLINYPIQGTAAELMKKAMVEVSREVLEKDSEIKLLLAIHDDLVFEMPEDKERVADAINKIRSIMCDIYPLSVPVEVDVKVGRAWGSLVPVAFSSRRV